MLSAKLETTRMILPVLVIVLLSLLPHYSEQCGTRTITVTSTDTRVVIQNPQFQRVVFCEGLRMNISCPQGKVVRIDNAWWGRIKKEGWSCWPVSTICIHTHEWEGTGWAYDNVKRACDGNYECRMRAANAEMGHDPCFGQKKSLVVHYRCEADTASPHVEKSITCEGDHFNVKCAKDEIISIKTARWGRYDTRQCFQLSPIGVKRRCYEKNPSIALQRLRRQCNGRSHCTWKAKTTVFGDDCPGVTNFLNFTYTCLSGASRSSVIIE